MSRKPYAGGVLARKCILCAEIDFSQPWRWTGAPLLLQHSNSVVYIFELHACLKDTIIVKSNEHYFCLFDL
jgi:hypothetical protein